jgi:type IVB pilus formation R64 PilN family outer membrane protein
VQPIITLNSVDMHWNGSLASFLDHVTGRLNLSWSYREGVVIIERYVTESFEFAAFGGSQDYKMNLTGSSSAGTGGAIMDVAESGKVEILTTIKSSIDQMIKSTNGTSVLNLSTGRITVTAQKDIMARLRELARAEDASLKRQAQIQIDVYSVTSNNSDEQGVDWNLVFNKMSEAWGASLKSPTSLVNSAASTMGINIISGIAGNTTSAEFGGSTSVVKLLNEVGGSAKVRPITMVAMNRQWARKTNLNSSAYVSETTSASSAGGTTGGQKTASITTGDKILVQPAILDNGEIMLKFGISLTELVSLLTVSSGTGASLSSVQTPNTSGIDDQSTVRLRAGEAMVVTGLSRKTATNNTRTLSENASVGVGGSQAQSFKREEFMIVVRAAQI